jgi:23S rRNA pseudouridine955/2504/2580 synthase
MTDVEHRTVGADDDGVRLDRWFKRHFPAIPHGALEKLLRTGQIRVDGARAKANARLAIGQAIRIPPLGQLSRIPAKAAGAPDPLMERESKELDKLVIFENSDLVILNKPPGLAVQGGTGTHRHLDRMIAARTAITGERWRLVHRLDKDTSGVLVLARTASSAASLAKAFKERETEKLYWALTAGVPKERRGRVDIALVKRADFARGGREAMFAAEEHDDDAQRAVTDYAVVDHAGPVCFIALRPVTGRTHQLRAHMAALGTPILGDFKYGEEAAMMSGGALPRGLMLHARRLTLPQAKGKPISVTAELPGPMAEAFKLLGFDAKDRSDPFAEPR